VRPAAPRIASVVRMDWGHDGEKMGWQRCMIGGGAERRIG
jgi:hypothetical protein